MIATVARILNRKPTFKGIKCKSRPHGLSHSNLSNISKGYAVTEKADGHNCLLAINDNQGLTLWLDDHIEKLDIKVNIPNQNIFECEHIKDYGYLIFDALVINGKDVTNFNFKQRYKLLTELFGVNKFENIFLKKFYFTLKENSIFRYNKIILNKAFPYLTDGLIFSPTSSKYYDKNITYKWKPPCQLTVDFLCKRNQKSDTLQLFCGINKNQFRKFRLAQYNWFRSFVAPNSSYFPIPFKPKGRSKFTDVLKSNLSKYENKIVECLWDGNGWLPLKIRTDKTSAYLSSDHLVGPNNWIVAVTTLTDALNPVTNEHIKNQV